MNTKHIWNIFLFLHNRNYCIDSLIFQQKHPAIYYKEKKKKKKKKQSGIVGVCPFCIVIVLGYKHPSSPQTKIFKRSWYTFKADNFVKIVLSPLEAIVLSFKRRSLVRRGLVGRKANRNSQKLSPLSKMLNHLFSGMDRNFGCNCKMY